MGLKWVLLLLVLQVTLQSSHAALNIGVYSASSKLFVFKWDKVNGAMSYEITITNIANQRVGFAAFGAYTIMGSVSSGLAANTNYTYSIEAKNATGAVLESASGQHLTAPERMDPIVSVTAVDSTTLEVEFVLKTGASKYIVRALDTQEPYTFFKEVEVTSSPAVVPSLQPYTQYKLSIMAANSGGCSQPTESVTAKTLLSPVNIQSSSPTNSSIELTWASVDFSMLYTVSVLKYEANETERISKNTTRTNYTFSDLDPGALYHIRAYAWDAEGRMGVCGEANQTTRPPTPAAVTVTMVNASLALNVSWSLDPDVYGDVLYNASSNPGLSCSSEGSSCELTPVSCAQTHSVEVTAYNEAGPSVPSSPISFTTIPCPPPNLAVVESSPGNCSFSWGSVSVTDWYMAYVKNADGEEAVCNTTTTTSCSFSCDCGYTYLMNVFAINGAGSSQPGQVLNYTTVPCCPESLNVSLVGTDTLEVEWLRARGAELYETRALDGSRAVLCNDTAPVCVLSYLSCDTSYNVSVLPCNELRGCNLNCPTLTRHTAACTPTGLSISALNSSAVTVSWSSTNRAATFTVNASGDDPHSCTTATGGSNCDLVDLQCGSSYEIQVTASSAGGESLPSYSELYETEPCCPATLTVKQVTQAMSNVSWSPAKGAHTFLTALRSSKGQARCHTEDLHCIMGCITCSTNYTVTMAAHSLSGLTANCSYDGFSSSLCCPSGIRIYRTSVNGLRVVWRSSPVAHATQVNMTGQSDAYSCSAQPGVNHCDLSSVRCGDEYNLLVVPVRADGSPEDFCPHRKYTVTCQGGGGVGSILFRGKRSLE